MRILLDVDGVLADWTRWFLFAARVVYGVEHEPHEVDQWDVAGWLEARYQTVQRSRIYELVNAPGWVASIPTIAPAIPFARALAERHEVYYVTSPTWSNPTWSSERAEWLRRHVGAPRDRLVITEAKHVVAGDVLVDDRPTNVRRWQAYHPHGTGLLLDAPHNRAVNDLPRLAALDRLADHGI